MADAGPNLEKWVTKLPKEERMDFMLNMLNQIVIGLKKIHAMGYTHSDLKTANICARANHDGSLRFTLIDFGMSAKVSKLGESYSSKELRGNLMFASIDHILRKRASQIDELYSIMCVAYYFIFGSLPWLKTIEYLHDKQQGYDRRHHINYYQRDRYIKLRENKRQYFD